MKKEIEKILEHLSKQTDGFGNPIIVMIGGYALIAFTAFSRYTIIIVIAKSACDKKPTLIRKFMIGSVL